MANYDFISIKEFIEKHKEHIAEVSLGMHEDWFWTAETVFQDGDYTKELNENTTIGGISGSNWATPVMEITYKDGSEERKECYTGKAGGQPPAFFALGCLSSPVQAARGGNTEETRIEVEACEIIEEDETPQLEG